MNQSEMEASNKLLLDEATNLRELAAAIDVRARAIRPTADPSAHAAMTSAAAHMQHAAWRMIEVTDTPLVDRVPPSAVGD